MAQKAQKKMTTGQKAGIGFGLTAAAAGAYFLYGSNKAAQNRKKVKGWMLKAKGEILEALENAKTLSEDEYKALVEAAAGAYGTVKSATSGEVKEFKKEMAEHWEKLQKSNAVKKIAGGAASKKSAAKPASKTPVKKEVKSEAKKVLARSAK